MTSKTPTTSAADPAKVTSATGRSPRRWLVMGLLLLAIALPVTWIGLQALAPSDGVYRQPLIHRPGGIGKVYMGREIAQVMGHTGATWLERPSRAWEEQPQQVVDALNLQPGDVVADIGAGTGYFSFRLAPQLPQGQVLAVDIQPEMLDIIEFFKQETGITNVEPILASDTDPRLPDNTVDLALMVDAYHEFAYPHEVMTALVKALKPGGRAVLVEYRGENPLIPIKALHKMTQHQVKQEMQAVGLEWVKTDESLPTQHLMVFRK